MLNNKFLLSSFISVADTSALSVSVLNINKILKDNQNFKWFF